MAHSKPLAGRASREFGTRATDRDRANCRVAWNVGRCRRRATFDTADAIGVFRRQFPAFLVERVWSSGSFSRRRAAFVHPGQRSSPGGGGDSRLIEVAIPSAGPECCQTSLLWQGAPCACPYVRVGCPPEYIPDCLPVRWGRRESRECSFWPRSASRYLVSPGEGVQAARVVARGVLGLTGNG